MQSANDRQEQKSYRTIAGKSRFALVLFCLTALSAGGQIRDLATTDDGSQLYFSTVFQLKGSNEFGNGKIFRYRNGDFELIAQVNPTAMLSDGSVFHFDFKMPNVTGDGSVLAYDGTATCTGPVYCPGSFTARGFIVGEQLPADMTSFGSLRVSHNGRYAIRFGGTAAGVPPGAPELYDSQAGQATLLRPCPALCIIGDGRQSIADDGTVLTTQGLWRNGQVTGPAINALTGRVSPNGSTIVYESVENTYCFGGMFGQCTFTNAIHVRDVASGDDVKLASSPSYTAIGNPKTYFVPTVSNDGRAVLYCAPAPSSALPQVYLSLSNGGVTRQLTDDPAGIVEAVLSGDGHLAYAVTQGGSILLIYVDSGQVTTVLPDTPYAASPTSALVPGSLMTLSVTAPADAEITIEGLPAPIVSVAPTAVSFQAPWEVEADRTVSAVIDKAANPFSQVFAFQTASVAPQHLASIHGDFRGLVSYDDPAVPGEILVLYLTGLGPVSPAVATGYPAPATPLTSLQYPMACTWTPGNQTAEKMFAGLAPLTIGLYQVNVRVPSAVVTQYGAATLSCTLVPPGGTPAGTGAVIPIRVAQ